MPNTRLDIIFSVGFFFLCVLYFYVVYLAYEHVFHSKFLPFLPPPFSGPENKNSILSSCQMDDMEHLHKRLDGHK